MSVSWPGRIRGEPSIGGGVVEQPVPVRAAQIPPVAPVAAAVQEVDYGLVVVEYAVEVQEHPQRLGGVPRGEAPVSRVAAAAFAQSDCHRSISSVEWHCRRTPDTAT